MFTDNRSKKIVLVSHCILNQNSISDGTVDFPGTFQEMVELLLDSKVGILQMPCPELLCLGLDRGDIRGSERDIVVENTRIRNALKQSSSLEIVESLVKQVVYQIEEYLKNDFSVLGIVGINRSPSCGVDTTSKNKREIEGKGIFVKSLEKKLKEKDIEIIGVRTSEIDKSVKKLKELLGKT